MQKGVVQLVEAIAPFEFICRFFLAILNMNLKYMRKYLLIFQTFGGNPSTKQPGLRRSSVPGSAEKITLANQNANEIICLDEIQRTLEVFTTLVLSRKEKWGLVSI